jgi:ATP-dependent exoDNAse (exonuclease V) beta subunit
MRIESAKPPNRETRSLNEYLRLIGADDVPNAIDAATLPEHGGDIPPLRAEFPIGTEREVQKVIEAREAWQAARQALFDAQRNGLRVHTASSLKAVWEKPDEVGNEIRRGDAADFGTAVHEVLERIDLRRPEDAPDLARVVALASGLTDRVDEIEKCARNVLGHDLIRRALASPRYLREVAFTAPLPAANDGGLAEGRIDLLFLEDGAITVVDFKTDAVTPDGVADRTAMYRNQALVYAWAAHHTTNLPVREVIFLYARLSHEDRIPVDAAFLSEAEDLLRSPAMTA